MLLCSSADALSILYNGTPKEAEQSHTRVLSYLPTPCEKSSLIRITADTAGDTLNTMFYLYDINAYHRNYGALQCSEEENGGLFPTTTPSLSWSDEDDNDDDQSSRRNHCHYRQCKRRGPQEQRLLNIDEAVQSLGMGIFQYRIAVAAGMLLAADSMEVVLLSFLSNVFKGSQDTLLSLQDAENSSDTMNLIVVLAGMLGALVWGILGDLLGRRPVFVGAAFFISIFGIATAFVTTYFGMLVTRWLVAFGIGGLTVPFCTFSEFLPPSQRGANLIGVQLFCIVGALIVHLVLSQTGLDAWRTMVLWCCIPSSVATILGLTVVPESPRWLLAQNRSEEALAILKAAAKANGKDPEILFPTGTVLYSHEPQDNQRRLSFWSMFSPGWIQLTATLWSTYFGMSFLTHGTISLAVSVFSNDHRQQDYQGIFTAASQFLALFVVAVLIDGLGRSSTQCLVYALGGVVCLIVSLLEDYDSEHHANMILAFTFLAHTCMFGGKCATWISTTEILATEMRTTGHGMANLVSRMGGFLSAYVITRIYSLPSVGLALFVISLWTASAASKLPETNAKEMGIVWHPPTSSSAQSHRRRRAGGTTCSTSNHRRPPLAEIHV
jgi:MFS transporter, putative metabolite:H+ symporter